MAKKSLIARQAKRLACVAAYDIRRAALKSQIKSASSLTSKFELYGRLQKLPRDSSRTRLRNRCRISGRPKAYLRDFGLSRHMLRTYGHGGLLPGLTKSSW